MKATLGTGIVIVGLNKISGVSSNASIITLLQTQEPNKGMGFYFAYSYISLGNVEFCTVLATFVLNHVFL